MLLLIRRQIFSKCKLAILGRQRAELFSGHAEAVEHSKHLLLLLLLLLLKLLLKLLLLLGSGEGSGVDATAHHGHLLLHELAGRDGAPCTSGLRIRAIKELGVYI